MRFFKRFRRFFPDFFAPFMTGFSHATQRRLIPLYVQELCRFSARKSMTPMAATVAPGQGDHFQHSLPESGHSAMLMVNQTAQATFCM